jgi:hypothetical protein
VPDGITEAVSGLALPGMPRALGFAKHRRARNFFLGLTGLTFAVAALTDWQKRQTPLQDA